MLGLIAAPLPASAATSSPACPTSAAVWDYTDNNLPPYPAGTPITDLVGCGTPYAPPAGVITNVRLAYGDLGLVDDGCTVVTALDVTSTGTPDGAGWAVLGFNTATDAPIKLTTGQDGTFQQFDTAAGATISSGGATLLSPSAQPASGSYSTVASLDPAAISLADLAAGHLGVAVMVLDSEPSDTVSNMTVTVTTDTSACKTTDTTVTPVTTAAPTTTAKAVAAAIVTPRFTG